MKARLFLLGVALTMLVASVAHSQTCNNHNATATITDSDGQVWANGSYTVAYYNPASTQPPVCRSTGVPIKVNYSGTINASGQITQSLPDTSSTDPSGQWIFTIQSNTSAAPSVMRPVTLTANTSFSSTWSAQIIAPRFAAVYAGQLSFGYSDSEVTSPAEGKMYQRTTDGVVRSYHGGVWQNVGGGGASGVSWANDLSGSTNTNQIVVGLRGHALPLLGSGFLNYDGTQWLFSTPVTFAGDLNGSLSSQTVVGLRGVTLPTLTGNTGALTYNDNTGTWSFGGAGSVTSGIGTPVATGQTCNANAVGTLYVDRTNVDWYMCKAIVGPSYIWAIGSWNSVQATNTPGANVGYSCVSNGTQNSCTWQAPSGGECMTPMTVQGSGSSNTITWTSIPQTCKSLLITGCIADAGNDDARLVFNSDTSTIYTRAYAFRGQTNIQGFDNSLGFAYIGNSGGGPTGCMPIEVRIMSYTNSPATYKSWVSQGASGATGGTPSNLSVINASGFWQNNTNAITRIDLINSASANWSTSTFLTLSGR